MQSRVFSDFPGFYEVFIGKMGLREKRELLKKVGKGVRKGLKRRVGRDLEVEFKGFPGFLKKM